MFRSASVSYVSYVSYVASRACGLCCVGPLACFGPCVSLQSEKQRRNDCEIDLLILHLSNTRFLLWIAGENIEEPCKVFTGFHAVCYRVVSVWSEKKACHLRVSFFGGQKRGVFLDAAWHLKEVENGDVERRKELSKQNERVTKVVDR